MPSYTPLAWHRRALRDEGRNQHQRTTNRPVVHLLRFPAVSTSTRPIIILINHHHPTDNAQRCTFISDSIMILLIRKVCSPSHGNNHSDLAKALGRGQSPSAWKPSLRSPCLATGETWSSAEQCDRGRLALCGHVNSSSSACACVRTYVCARADFNTKV